MYSDGERASLHGMIITHAYDMYNERVLMLGHAMWRRKCNMFTEILAKRLEFNWYFSKITRIALRFEQN